MHEILGSLELRLREIVSRAGFIRMDAGAFGDGDHGDIGRLEYRRTSSNPKRLLLDFCLIESEHQITASYWSPDDLTPSKLVGGVEAVAVAYQAWQYDAFTDPEDLAVDVAATVARWLE